MKNLLRQSGFSLVELVVTLAVAAILLALAAPSFSNFVANNRMAAATNTVVTALSYARSEAVRRSQTVTIVPSGSGWAGGWEVRDQNAQVLRSFDPLSSNMTITDADNNIQLTFDGRGLLVGAANGVNLSICDNRSGETGREIQISPTGRPYLNREFPCG